MTYRAQLDRLHAAGTYRQRHPVTSAQGPEITYRGKVVVNLSSNNYLGLAHHPKVIEAAKTMLSSAGLGAGAARLICGNHEVFETLEARLATFKGTESALLFGSGYTANLGLLQALAEDGTVYCDRLNHASLIDGARLSGASLRTYPHRDNNQLNRRLRRTEGPVLVATDGVFSMDGDLAPLRELADLCTRHSATLLVDDAHGTGVLADDGSGSVHLAGLNSTQVPVQMGTLGKALGGYGAFVAGSADLIDYLVNRARSFIFTTALPPAIAAGALAALEIVMSDEGQQRREALQSNRTYLANGLKALGWNVPDCNTPILPLLVGDTTQAAALSERLLESGILAAAVRPPTVPEGTSRLRVTVMCDHTHAHLDKALAAIDKPPRPSGG